MLDITEKIVSGKPVFDGKIIHVEHWDVILPDGKPALREVARHPGASAIVPVDADNNVYLVKQFRAPLKRITLEIPAGKLDHIKEDRKAAAERELSEETGFTASELTHLTDLATTPGFCDEVISIYLATKLTAGQTNPDEDEFLNLVKMPLEEACRLALSGQLQDSKTIVGLLLAKEALKK